jgi:phage-related protein (TIGR01555 family)
MSKKKPVGPRLKRKRSTPLHQEIKNEEKRLIANGLSDVIMGFNPGGMGTPVSQVDTLFTNQRWYLISNMRQVLSEAYVEHGLIQTIVDVPVNDGLRGGIDIKTKQLSPEQIVELSTEIEREDIISGVVGRALKWNRLFGGGAVLIINGDYADSELDPASIQPGDPLTFRPVDMWELFYDQQNVSEQNTSLEPVQETQEFYDYYGKKIHKSRVLIMKGLTPPSFIRPRLRGWGFSVVEALVRSINQYLKSVNLTFEVLDEFKVDVFKIKGLSTALMSPQGSAAIQQRVALANQQKDFQHAITMDKEDDYEQKQVSFGGIAEVMAGIRMQIASDMRIPLTKLFGISSAGFNSGEDDIENYNAMIESEIRAKAKYDILQIVELKCQQKFGFIPDDLSIGFKPLRILSTEQEENVKTQRFNRVLQAKQAGEITSKEFRDACNTGELLPIQLDPDVELPKLQKGDQDEEEALGELKAPKSKIQAKEAAEADA